MNSNTYCKYYNFEVRVEYHMRKYLKIFFIEYLHINFLTSIYYLATWTARYPAVINWVVVLLYSNISTVLKLVPPSLTGWELYKDGIRGERGHKKCITFFRNDCLSYQFRSIFFHWKKWQAPLACTCSKYLPESIIIF